MKRITRFFDQIAASIHFFKTHRLKRNYRRALLFFAILLPVCVVAIIAGQRLHQPTPSSSKAAIALSTTKKKQQRHKATSHKTKVHTAPKNIDWTAPSEKQAYPDLTQHPNITLDVNLKSNGFLSRKATKRYTRCMRLLVLMTQPHEVILRFKTNGVMNSSIQTNKWAPIIIQAFICMELIFFIPSRQMSADSTSKTRRLSLAKSLALMVAFG
ncbi:D-alanyl-D-alanine carboxypeptidase [Lacticaseibacillus paracasei]|nr:D-alanyl-D-alanine carboxypeptidase [Lacticaseibacillus paracasei]